MTKQTHTPPHPISWIGILAALIGSILFSTKAIIVKKSFSQLHIDVSSLLTLRMFFSLPFYLLMGWWASRSETQKPLTRVQWFKVIALGLTGYYASSFFDFAGLQYISAGLERLILFLYPTFVLLINLSVFKQKVMLRQWLALALTYAGIALVFWGEVGISGMNSTLLHGAILVLCCAITYAIYIAGSGRVIPQVGVSRFTSYAMIAATVGIFLHFIVSKQGAFGSLIGPGYWQYGLLIAVVATVIPTFLTAKAMQLIGSNNVAIVSSIGPVSTIVQAYFFLQEPIFGEQLAGTALVVAGVVLIGWKKRVSGSKKG